MDVRELIAAEIELINQMFDDHGIQARTHKKRTSEVKSSFISYGLKLGPGESLKRVEAIKRELSNDLTRKRVQLLRGYSGRSVVRLREYPLALEVPHPSPTPLSWHDASMRTGSYRALVGRSYSYTGASEEYVDLDKHYHMLVAAMSGGGKSTLMRMALLTLTHNTSPGELQIVLVDLKNDDLTPFKKLPHVINYAGDIESAAAAIDYVHSIKTQRIKTQDKPFRLLLVIDELAELGADKETLKKLGSILSTGRSLGINVWAGTQYPSASAIGNIVAASFTTRLVGMVDGKTAALVATKRAGSGAEALTLPGDFLRVDGAELVRMKCYNIDQADTAKVIDMVAGKTSKHVDSSIQIELAPLKTATEELAEKIAEMYASGASKRSMAMHAFGKQYGGSIAAKIDEAIEWLQANSDTESATTTGATSATTRVNDEVAASSSSTIERGKIIKFPIRKASGG